MHWLTAENALTALAVASALLPCLQYIASRTKNKTDDRLVAELAGFIEFALSWVPRVRFGGKK